MYHRVYGPNVMYPRVHGPSVMYHIVHGPNVMLHRVHGPSAIHHRVHGPIDMYHRVHGNVLVDNYIKTPKGPKSSQSTKNHIPKTPKYEKITRNINIYKISKCTNFQRPKFSDDHTF